MVCPRICRWWCWQNSIEQRRILFSIPPSLSSGRGLKTPFATPPYTHVSARARNWADSGSKTNFTGYVWCHCKKRIAEALTVCLSCPFMVKHQLSVGWVFPRYTGIPFVVSQQDCEFINCDGLSFIRFAACSLTLCFSSVSTCWPTWKRDHQKEFLLANKANQRRFASFSFEGVIWSHGIAHVPRGSRGIELDKKWSAHFCLRRKLKELNEWKQFAKQLQICKAACKWTI